MQEINSAGKGNDTDRVWASDVEQAFQEAQSMYHLHKREKIFLPEEGKMYGMFGQD